MNLSFVGHDHRYAVEQMLQILLPGVPLTDQDPGGDTGTVTLTADGAAATFTLDGHRYTGAVDRCELPDAAAPDEVGFQRHLVKLAVYRALIQHTGQPPWGALSGVRPAKLVARWLNAGMTEPDVTALLTGVYGLRPDKAALALRCAQESRQAARTLAAGELSLYLGIPFCPSRCTYCSFISHDVKGALALVAPYVDALCRELLWAGDYLQRNRLRVRTVYMGGGTPTTLSPDQLARVLGTLRTWLPQDGHEFTVEAGRPDTITAEKLAVLRAYGVNRVSVNPQTLSDDVLRAMGRAHTAQQFRDAYALARSAGFSAINTDLIAGLPGDTPDGFCATLDEILSLAPDDLTVHTLSLKHGAALSATPQHLPTPEEVGRMLDTAAAALPAHGYRPYYLYRQKYMTGALENVGWTRGKGSLYNIAMMEELHSVLALGSGGVTKLVDRQSGAIRRHTNPKYPKEYLERLGEILQEREQLSWPMT